MKTIVVIYQKSPSRKQEFHCHGDKNTEICDDCMLRYECLTTAEDLEIPMSKLGIKAWTLVDAPLLAEFLVPTLKTRTKEVGGKKRVKVNFNKLRKFI